MPIDERPRYTQFSNSTMEEILSFKFGADGLAIWLYLLSRPEHWKPRPEDVIESLGMTVTRYQRGLRIVNHLGLIKESPVRDSAGKVIGKELCVYQAPQGEVSS